MNVKQVSFMGCLSESVRNLPANGQNEEEKKSNYRKWHAILLRFLQIQLNYACISDKMELNHEPLKNWKPF